MELNNLQRQMYDRAAFLCSKSEKSSGSIHKKLLNWGLSTAEAEHVVNMLVAEKFVDDERFSRSYVRDKFRFNKWGKVKIAYHLRMEKIMEPIISDALERIDDEEYFETLSGLLKEKDRNISAVNQYDRKGRLFRFAQSRGFEPDLIYKAIDHILR